MLKIKDQFIKGFNEDPEEINKSTLVAFTVGTAVIMYFTKAFALTSAKAAGATLRVAVELLRDDDAPESTVDTE